MTRHLPGLLATVTIVGVVAATFWLATSLPTPTPAPTTAAVHRNGAEHPTPAIPGNTGAQAALVAPPILAVR